MPQSVMRRAPAVAVSVSVSIEETSSAKAKFDRVMLCLHAARKSVADVVRCYTAYPKAGGAAGGLGR